MMINTKKLSRGLFSILLSSVLLVNVGGVKPSAAPLPVQNNVELLSNNRFNQNLEYWDSSNATDVIYDWSEELYRFTLKHYNGSSAYNVSTWQRLYGLPAGEYRLEFRAGAIFTAGSATQKVVSVKDPHGNDLAAPIVITPSVAGGQSMKTYTIESVILTGNEASVEINIASQGLRWEVLVVDYVSFTRIGDAADALIVYPAPAGIEMNNAFTAEVRLPNGNWMDIPIYLNKITTV